MGNSSSSSKAREGTGGRKHVNPSRSGIPSLVHFSASADLLEFKPADSSGSPAYACSAVQGKRVRMEDEHIAVRPLFRNQQEVASLFGVFDGHGGAGVAKFLKDNMASSVGYAVQAATANRTSVEQALVDAFLQVDSAFLRSKDGDADMGSCAVCILIKGNMVYCANTGYVFCLPQMENVALPYIDSMHLLPARFRAMLELQLLTSTCSALLLNVQRLEGRLGESKLGSTIVQRSEAHAARRAQPHPRRWWDGTGRASHGAPGCFACFWAEEDEGTGARGARGERVRPP